MKLKKCVFPVFTATIAKEKTFHHNHVAYPNYCIPKIAWTKLLQGCIFYHIAKDPDLNSRVKMQQKLIFFKLLLPLLIYQWGFDLCNMSQLSWHPMIVSWSISCSRPPSGRMSSNITCVIMLLDVALNLSRTNFNDFWDTFQTYLILVILC